VVEIPVVKPPHFAIVTDPPADGVAQVQLTGDFDMAVETALADALVAAVRQPGVHTVVADLHGTTFLDSHGIAGLVAGWEAATSSGRRFTVTGAAGLVRQVLDITGLAEVLIPADAQRHDLTGA
jgi:anti-anti-sigma factor